jgi:hypothetical protein
MAGLVPAMTVKTVKRCQCYRDARHKAGRDAEGAVMAGCPSRHASSSFSSSQFHIVAVPSER